MDKIPDIFSCMVFTDSVMKERLPHDTYKTLRRCVATGESLTRAIADIVASAMKDWAIEKGATHFTHWFQPLTGITAEKHDSFISPNSDGGIIMEFSGKELIKGEPDASSFPSGGLRATFEARGYTAWDPTSPAFIKEDTLYIPTAFCSYTGEALDKKTPLLRSMEAINIQALRVLRALGDRDCGKVITTVGAEQEYFLVPKELFDQRKDLIYTGRTLFGAKPPKAQELDDHYFGAIKPRVAAYMRELDKELWKLGVLAKTEHNEAAPAQHELAPIFTTTNISCDHNQLTMELMKKVALRHGLVCLLHEKPFAGVNGSGKHNNWSISTDSGENLLYPGKSPAENTKFLLFLTAVIKAVDEYQDLLRMTVASAANDHRLGANEAPPAIVSIFLGEELTAILEAMENDCVYTSAKANEVTMGVPLLPRFKKDNTDRNRTSPFAFTGNKFEFRMLGSSLSISGPNTVINTIVADALREVADTLEKADDVKATVNDLIKKNFAEHKRIVFNGDGYSENWVKEAEKRGLLNLRCAPEAIMRFTDRKNIDLFARHNIFSESEMFSRKDILIESYCKVISIEAATMLEIARKDIFPAVSAYIKSIGDTVAAKKLISSKISCACDEKLAEKISDIADAFCMNIDRLETELSKAKSEPDIIERAVICRDSVIAAMNDLRAASDEMETLVGESYWPFPTYGKLLFGI